MTQDPSNLDFTDTVARKAFRLLMDSPSPLSAADLTAKTNADEHQVLGAFASLKTAGRAEFDDQGRLLGIYGLTLKPTEHHLVLRSTTFFVWCAFDSVGIPAALGESAVVSSACAQCGRALELAIEKGRPPSAPFVISWLPQRCDSIRDEFCPTVNFYCSVEHYRASLADGAPADAYLSLEAAAAIGRDNWGWARTSDA